MTSTDAQWRYWLVAVVIGVTALCLYFYPWLVHKEVERVQSCFPEEIGDWVGEDVEYDEETIAVLRADRIIYKHFRKDGSSPITVFIAYYKSLEKADFSHSPVVCFTGQGWETQESEKKAISVSDKDAKSIRVNQMVQKKLDKIMIALYWYQSGSTTSANRGIHKLRLFLGRIRGNSDENIFVRITSIVSDDESIEKTLISLYKFVHELYPLLVKDFV